MLQRIRIRGFKRFADVDIELGDTVLFIGPNNSGKTTVLQALSLWQLGLRQWLAERGAESPDPRGVVINRHALVSTPVPDIRMLWRGLQVRASDDDGTDDPVLIRVDVEGLTGGSTWSCGFEFEYANPESLYCRPIERGDAPPIPEAATTLELAYLPPMSGLQSNEVRLDDGAVRVRIGEGRTAEVLRNLCYRLFEASADTAWPRLCSHIDELFGVELEPPRYIPERGEIAMSYRERGAGDARFDLSAAGRGMQQTLLLLAYLYTNPGAVLLLDEPDAHLEILRQRQIYNLLDDTARRQHGQLIAASHSEVLLNEAADRDVVVAFVGRPHRIDDRGSQVAKSLKSIGFEHYVQAEQQGWVLYLEGATDLSILRAFAHTLEHPVAPMLERPFACYVENRLAKARDHFFGLREAQPTLRGIALIDRQPQPPSASGPLREEMWRRREIENYLCFPEVLVEYAQSLSDDGDAGPLFQAPIARRFVDAARESISDNVPPKALRDPSDRWWLDVKASDDYLDRVFADMFDRLGLPNLMRKTDYHRLASLVPRERIDAEVVEKLDAILAVARGDEP